MSTTITLFNLTSTQSPALPATVLSIYSTVPIDIYINFSGYEKLHNNIKAITLFKQAEKNFGSAEI